MTDKNALDITEILEVLPHRYPFLLVDKIVSLIPKKRVIGIKNVTMNEPFFQGHFPGRPIMPGVLILEAMAQTGGFLMLHLQDDPKSKQVFFTGIDKAKFRKPVVPGDQLRFEVEFLRQRQSLCKMHGQAFVDDRLVCEAHLAAAIMEKDYLFR